MLEHAEELDIPTPVVRHVAGKAGMNDECHASCFLQPYYYVDFHVIEPLQQP